MNSGPSRGQILDEITSSALSTEFDDLDQAVVENTRRRVFDMIGCAVGGSALEDVRAVVSALGPATNDRGATALGLGRTLPVHDAAMVNCIAGRSFDWGPLTLVIDDSRTPSHISETSVLTGVAVGEHLGVSGEDLLTAIVVGDDIAARAWLAAGDRPMPGGESGIVAGFEQWGTVTTLAAAIIAGRLFGLTQHELKNAMALAVGMMTGAGHALWDGATSFKLSQGSASRNGILAAQLAQAGWTGIDEPLFGERGYYSVFETGCDAPEWLYEDLGNTFYVENCFKPYPGGRPTDAPIEAAIRLSREHDIDFEDVDEFVVRPKALARHYTKPYEVGEYPPGHALFSFKYAAASALVHGKAGNAQYTPEGVRNAQVQELIQKTTLEPIDRDLESWGCEVEVQSRSTSSIEAFVEVPNGDPSNPMSKAELTKKFENQARFAGTIEEAHLSRFIDRIDHLVDVEDVGTITRLAKGEYQPL